MDIRTSNSNKPTGTLAVPFDWAIAKSAMPMLVLVMDSSFHTAVIISVFSDKRAGRDDKLPMNQTDRRGWCGSEVFAEREGDEWGSLLWLYCISKATSDVEEAVRFTVWESLQWMVWQKLADRIVVTPSWFGEASEKLSIRIQIWRNSANARPDYDVVWDSSVRRSA